MRRYFIVFVAIVSASICASGQRRGGPRGATPGSDQYPLIPRAESEKRILAAIEGATKAGELYANVPTADGRLLRLLTEAADAKHVVEIGTSTGLSGMWFCMALEKTGGKLTTFEFDPGRAATARKHFKEAGVKDRKSVV